MGLEARGIARDSPAQHPPPEVRALTGLRGGAATAVALAHFQHTFPANYFAPFMWNHAVDLFFCLSGFTLSYVYDKETFRFSSYLTARIARIYPLYLVCLIAAGVIYVSPFMIAPVTYPDRNAIWDFVRQLLMVNAWPLIGSGVHWDQPAWSLSAEWLCYLLLFPLLLFLQAPPSPATRLLGIVLLSAASYSLFVRFYDGNLPNPELHTPESQWTYWIAAARGMLGFAAGWIAFASFEKQDGLCKACTRFGTLIWCGAALIVLAAYIGLINPQALIFVYPFIVLAAIDPTSATSRLLGSQPLHILGLLSYSIYMIHFVVLVAFVRWFSTPDHWPMWTFILLVAAMSVVSVATYYGVEIPTRNWIRGATLRKLAKPHDQQHAAALQLSKDQSA